MDIVSTIERLKNKYTDVQVIAVSKQQSDTMIMKAYRAGQRNFGENRVQELIRKYVTLPKDICWHMIGHLQTNKVKYIAPFIHTIHSTDSWKLLQKINIEALKNNRTINCLLQIHIAQEEHKFGFHIEDIEKMLYKNNWETLQNIKIIGVMGMATFTENKQQIRNEFKKLVGYYDLLKKNNFSNDKHFNEISMGMSGDYKIAIKEGATMIRIGSLIFHNCQ